MVATRTSTRSLPQKQASFAELQATWTKEPKSKLKNRDSAPLKKLTKRSAPESDTSISGADGTLSKKAQRTAAAESKSSATSKTNASAGKPTKRSVAKSEEPAHAPAVTSPIAKGRKTTAVNALLQQFPVPVTQMATTNPPKFNHEAQTTFLSLPPEIRNEIYSLALVEDGPLRVRTVHPYLLEPGLLATNGQVRSEALGLWYGENVFEIDGSSPAVKFLRAMSDDKLRAVQCFRILTTFVPADDYIKTRIEQLLREFQPRGLGRQAIHFMMSVPDGFEWVNLASLRRLSKGKRDKDG